MRTRPAVHLGLSEPSRWRRPIALPAWWSEHRLALAALVLLVLVLFPGAILRGRTFYLRDIHLQWHGQMESFVRAVASGSWPVWDPWISFGQPLWANANNQLLYPTTWLNLVLPPWTVFTIFVAFHAVLGGAGVYFWSRQLGSSGAGSWVAAALWTASGPLLSCVNLWNHYSGAAWIPWALLFADRALSTGRLPAALAWGTAMAAQLLSGSPDAFLMTSLLAAARVASYPWRVRLAGSSLPRRAGLATAAWAFALALSAGQWLPTLEVARASSRWHLPFALRAAWSLPPAGLLQALLPMTWNSPALTEASRAALFGTREPLLMSVYVGLPAVALVTASIATRRRREAAFFASVCLAAVVLALGSHTPAYELVTRLLPPLAMVRYPSKAMVVAALCWAVVAGMGFDAWRESGPAEGAWPRWRVAGPMAAALALSAVAATLLLRGGGPGAISSAARGVVPALVLGVAALGLTTRAGPRPAALAAALCVADLLLAGRGLNPTAPLELLRARPPVLGAIHQEDRRRLYVYDYQAAPGLARRHLGRDHPYFMHTSADAPSWVEAIGTRSCLAPPVAEVWGVFQSYDVDAMGLQPVAQSSLSDLLLDAEGTSLHLRLLQMGAVSQVVALHEDGFESLRVAATFPGFLPEPIRVLSVPDSLPRTYAVAGVRVADGQSALALLADPHFDPTREIVLPAGVPATPDPGPVGTSRIVAFRADRVLLEADMVRDGYVVLVDAYGAGWKAMVDGRPAPLLRANVAFRAVAVPAGRHRIELIDRPVAILAGLAISLTALLGAIPALRTVRRTLDSVPVPR